MKVTLFMARFALSIAGVWTQRSSLPESVLQYPSFISRLYTSAFRVGDISRPLGGHTDQRAKVEHENLLGYQLPGGKSVKLSDGAWKLIIVYLAFLSLASTALGQTFFDLRNLNLHHTAGDVNAPVFDAEGVPLSGTNYLAELWGSPSPDSLKPLLSYVLGRRAFVPFYRSGRATPGYFWGETWMYSTNLTWGWSWLQIRAWDRSLGSTYEEVAARGLGGYGESPLFYAQGSGGPLCEPPCEGAPLIGLQSFKLQAAAAVLMREVRRQDNQVVIEWAPGFKQYQLQETSDVGQPWQNVGDQTPLTSATNVIGGSMKFFRVVGFTQ